MPNRKDLTKQTIRFYFRHAWRYPKHVIGLAISIPCTVLANNIIPPIILANVLNRLSRHDFQSHRVWASFGPELSMYAAIVILAGVTGWRIVDALDWRLEGNVERDIAREVFDHLQQQSATFHANHFGGSMVSQTNKLMGSYIRFADTTVFNVLPLLFSLLFICIILGHIAVWYALIILAFAVLYIVSSFYVTRPVRRLGAEQAARESAQTGVLADAITNVMAIKSFSGSAYENKRFAKATDHTRAGLLSMLRYNQRQQAYFSTIVNVISASALLMAVVGVVVFGANIATVFLLLTYTASVANQLFQFSNSALRTYNRALGDASDMIGILGITPEIADPKDPETSRISRGLIDFDHVTFQHDGADDALFDDLSVRIKPGEKVGLV
ncbi:MAG TPA: ABC transporter ATP-binding protein, partial [Candidatus Saccharimonadales bacterium]|nr:ABC transporter ATP-binding protein [Candidatus Saccharimonadales bacterium]